MKTVIIKNTRVSRSVMDFGWGNGYVVIPAGHHLHGKYYDDIDVAVHGGLTYSQLITKEIAKLFNLESDDVGKWIVGFDTYHSGDTLDEWTKEAVQDEADRLMEQLKTIPC